MRISEHYVGLSVKPTLGIGLMLIAALFVLTGCDTAPEPTTHRAPPTLQPPLPEEIGPQGALLVTPLNTGATANIDADASAAQQEIASNAEVFRNLLIKNLRQRQILALERAGRRPRFMLRGNLAETRDLIEWIIMTPDGLEYGAATQKLSDIFGTDDPELLSKMADEAARTVDKMIDNGLIGKGHGQAAIEPPAMKVIPVVGAPETGAKSLTLAISIRLRLAGVRVAGDRSITGANADDDTSPYSLSASLSVTENPDNSEHIAVEWILYAPDGNELGNLEQENDMPKGEVDKNWEAVSGAVASAALPGILALMENHRLSQSDEQAAPYR